MRDISLVKFLPSEPKVPFISARTIAAVLSVLALIGSVFLFFNKGLNYGIDFTGGTVLELDTGSEPPLDDLRVKLGALGMGDPGLQTIAPPPDAGIDHSYVRVTIPIQEEDAQRELDLDRLLIQSISDFENENFVVNSETTNRDEAVVFNVTVGETPLLLPLRVKEELEIVNPRVDEIQSLIRGYGINAVEVSEQSNGSFDLTIPKKMEASANVQQVSLGYVKVSILNDFGPYTIRSQDVVGSKVSGELRQKGVLAILLALGMVLFYIWFRFEWQFAVGAVMALFHDVLLTIGVFSLTQLEFNLSIIAAILTIVGYSLNDTVIVYDRIRENLRKYKKMALPELLNLSINDTLSRTIMTSMTTLLALVALYVLGGPGLHGFAFAMIWGVFVGTYSSIFVASPLLLLLKLKRGPVAES